MCPYFVQKKREAAIYSSLSKICLFITGQSLDHATVLRMLSLPGFIPKQKRAAILEHTNDTTAQHPLDKLSSDAEGFETHPFLSFDATAGYINTLKHYERRNNLYNYKCHL